MTEEQRLKIYLFAASCDLGVIATNSLDRKSPEAALVAVTITENLDIIFGTSADSRKSKNIMLNPNIAFVIGGDEIRKTTIQVEGKALLLEGVERKTAEELHCTRHPNSTKYRNDPKQQYFKMMPQWIRYHNSSASPTEEWEIVFPSGYTITPYLEHVIKKAEADIKSGKNLAGPFTTPKHIKKYLDSLK